MTDGQWCASSMLDALGCAVGKHGAVYLSTPITNGPRLVAWCRDRGRADAAPDDIVAANLDEGRAHAERLRMRYAAVIDPTRMSVPGWTQDDYRTFWCEVVRRFAERVVLADGWEYSTGCTLEYLTARSASIGVEDVTGRAVDDRTALRLLDAAVDELASVGLDNKAQVEATSVLALNAKARPGTVP